ncbi:MAG: hypothetical protein ACK4M1_06605 [Flavobacterium sp.]
MIDFREVTIVDNSSTYENLVLENKTYKRKNYFLTVMITAVVIVSVLSYIEKKKEEKIGVKRVNFT